MWIWGFWETKRCLGNTNGTNMKRKHLIEKPAPVASIHTYKGGPSESQSHEVFSANQSSPVSGDGHQTLRDLSQAVLVSQPPPQKPTSLWCWWPMHSSVSMTGLQRAESTGDKITSGALLCSVLSNTLSSPMPFPSLKKETCRDKWREHSTIATHHHVALKLWEDQKELYWQRH